MRWPLLARCVVAGTCLAGCSVLAGISDGRDDAPPTGADEAGPADAPRASEGGGKLPDGAACVAKTAPAPAGPIHAKRAAVAPVLDGLFDDWACVDRVDVGAGSYENGLPAGAPQSVSFAFQWTGTDLYFYAHAVTAAPGFENVGDQIFKNDSVHLIIGRAPPKADDGRYRMGDHQLAIDYRQRKADYVNGVAAATVAAEARVTLANGATGPLDFQIEARMSAASLGLPSGLTSATTLVVNLQLVDGKDNGIGFRVWRLPPLSQCPCVVGCCERIGKQNSPTCDMRCTEGMILDD